MAYPPRRSTGRMSLLNELPTMHSWSMLTSKSWQRCSYSRVVLSATTMQSSKKGWSPDLLNLFSWSRLSPLVNTTIFCLLPRRAFSVCATPGNGVAGMLSRLLPMSMILVRVSHSTFPPDTFMAFSMSEIVNALLP